MVARTKQAICLSVWYDQNCNMMRVGQNRMHKPYMTVYLVVSLPRIPYIHRYYMVLANATYDV